MAKGVSAGKLYVAFSPLHGINRSVKGLHSGAFYVGRSELLAWVNEVLQLNYTKIVEVSNGEHTRCQQTRARCAP